MSSNLMIDIGAGTMDILYYDDDSGLSYKAVVCSPVRHLAQKAARLTGNILVLGNEMGGGSITGVLRERARTDKVVMTLSAAATVHHDLEKVTGMGIRVVDQAEAAALARSGDFSVLEIGDLELKRIKRIVKGFGVPFRFDRVGICAQDHGVAPKGVSHLDYRHGLFKAVLDQTPFPHSLLHPRDKVPVTFNRLCSIAETSRQLPAGEAYLMDSGMAAVLGASLDLRAATKKRVLVLDIATSHTVGAALDDGELAGFFEYHTHDITLPRLEELIVRLAEGTLKHEAILAEGGHGAYIRTSFGFSGVDVIVATGPKRQLVQNSKLPIVFGAPFGDNMMTGTVGLLEAIRRFSAMPALRYL